MTVPVLDDGREDGDIIRLEGDGLRIACYRMEA